MTTVTVSPKFGVEIPPEIRDALGLKPGQQLVALAYEGRIELIPERPIREARGMLRGMKPCVPRDEDRR